MNLSDLPLLFESKQAIVAVETPVTERFKILEFIDESVQNLQLPLYFWNTGYSVLQLFNENRQLISTQNQCTLGLNWLLEHPDIPGVFVFEGAISPNTLTGMLSQQTEMMLSNLVYDLAANSVPRFLICMESYVELTHSLAPLIPVLVNPLPSTLDVINFVQNFCNNQFFKPNSTEQHETLVRTCLGLPLGELEILLKRLSRFTYNLEQLIDGVLGYKKSKLKGHGVEFISEPDVPQAAGLDLLSEVLERAAVLLKPEAKQHNLSFPKGMILWGPPGTGKSLSAKLAAKKMGVPMVAADWAGLRGTTAYESRKNLREFLQFCDANGEHGLVLYFDDFDKGFAGFDSASDGGVSRQLAGKLLTWMQERTSQVLVMATVNRLEFLPPELIRRFDEIIFVDLPHTGARYEIFKLHLAKYFPGLDFCEKDWLRLLRETKLLTPAEIALMVRKTAEDAFYWNVQECSSEGLGEKPLTVTVRDFLEVRSQFTPSMIREEDKIVEIRNKAVYARPASSPDTSRWAKEPEVLFGS
ncbi:MAG: ATP-binding protein [Richelia sp. RM1_1_1]|nr:ATP-binding protein [Richelia sp. RM1_1_1]